MHIDDRVDPSDLGATRQGGQTRCSRGLLVYQRRGLNSRLLFVLCLLLLACGTAPILRFVVAEPVLSAVAEPKEKLVAATQNTKTCARSTFETRDAGIVWNVGATTILLSTTEVRGKHAYNYTERTTRIEVAGDPTTYIASSCYTETDCDVPPDANG